VRLQASGGLPRHVHDQIDPDRVRPAATRCSGDIAGNADKARHARAVAAARAPTSCCSASLFIVGYPPRTSVLKPALQADARAAIEALAP
jgi:hypothetical protein